VFQRGNNMLFVLKGAVSLKTSYRRRPQTADQIRVFAERLLHPSPPRFAGHINNRRQGLMGPPHTGFISRHCVQPFNKVRVKGAPQTNGLRKTGRLRRRMPMKAFFMKNNRNPQPALFNEKLLNRVGQFRRLARIFPAGCIARPRNLSQTISLRVTGLGFGPIKLAFLVNQCFHFIVPDAQHLRDLFFQCHSGNQVFDPPFHRIGRI